MTEVSISASNEMLFFFVGFLGGARNRATGLGVEASELFRKVFMALRGPVAQIANAAQELHQTRLAFVQSFHSLLSSDFG